ncbi:DUF2478 domain-containing protein [Poseidonocella sp. HB161398]|uniref:DUF2478 domain-containing protein n=1 Tax=Poseidonocella sp. HB161398 TaxID=2320855 RepID=UPI001109EBAD|nr:DUF2478 domain-containing protein [Poseidonocella sp. HB161398]
MRIGYVTAEGRGDGDRLLCALAERLGAQGLRLAGVVQHNTDRADDSGCDMDVRVLPDGPLVRISQSLGAGSSGCRLDAGALEQAVGLVGASMAAGADLLMVNKFGKHEAEGRGFRALIGDALAAEVPVIVGVAEKNMPAFLEFAGEFAEPVPAETAALEAWALGMRAGTAA